MASKLLDELFPPMPFPACPTPARNEEGFESEGEYLCLVRDVRFGDAAEILILRAFSHEFVEDGVTQAWKSWFDRNGNLVSHFEDGHDDDRRVVRWCPLENAPLACLLGAVG